MVRRLVSLNRSLEADEADESAAAEFSGVIEEVGDNVDGDWKKGDRVVMCVPSLLFAPLVRCTG